MRMKTITECQNNGVKGWKYGKSGFCHIGTEAKQRAIREQKEEMARAFVENPREIPTSNKE